MSAFLHVVITQMTLSHIPVVIVTYFHLYESEIAQNFTKLRNLQGTHLLIAETLIL
jgi:hypothetical protein